MKIILNQTVPKVGKEGTVVNVADGFARNFLFPKGLAIIATKQQLIALEKRNERVAVKTAGLKAAAEALRDNLNGKNIRIPGEIGAQGKLFGAITSQNVVDAIHSQLGATLDKRQVALVEPIRRLGEYTIELDLHREVDAKITLSVFDPHAPVAAAPVEEAVSAQDEDYDA